MTYRLDFDTDRFHVANDGAVTYVGDGEDYEALESQGYSYELDVHVIENGVDLKGRPMITGRAMATVFVDILNIPEVPDPPSSSTVVSRISRTGAWCQWQERAHLRPPREPRSPPSTSSSSADGEGDTPPRLHPVTAEAGGLKPVFKQRPHRA